MLAVLRFTFTKDLKFIVSLEQKISVFALSLTFDEAWQNLQTL